MALDMTAEQKQLGKDNFKRTAEGLTRRGFMKSMTAAGAVVPVSAAVYFGYQKMSGKPVKAALIGAGDEGGVLVGEHNPEFLEFVAVCDIRPSNIKRIFDGDAKVPLRKGFKKVYGEQEAKHIEVYDDYKKLLERKDIEAVVIATPLHLHAPIAVDAMRAGKHVLTEKLMARTITQCKEMIRTAHETRKILSVGHQRHYSLLYQHAVEILQNNIIGDIKHIRALWHRNNSWPLPAADTPEGRELRKDWVIDPNVPQPFYRDGWFPAITTADFDKPELKDPAYLKEKGFRDIHQLVRWRLFNSSGGGLMAELGSHQLDACSIFLGKVKPLNVVGVGARSLYRPGRNERPSEDHVFVTFEFPGKNHPLGANKGSDKEDIVVVTYSSINSNGFEAYGECVMGTQGTMIVETEQSIMIYKERNPMAKADTAPREMKAGPSTIGSEKPVLEAASTWGGPPPATASAGGPAAGPSPASGTYSRGYREEMEDFAYCIRTWDEGIGYGDPKSGEPCPQRLPRCHGEVAMADAILALTANLSMLHARHDEPNRIKFRQEWFQTYSDAVPDKDERLFKDS